MPGGGDASRARERRGPAERIDHPDLADLPVGIVRQQCLKGVGCRGAIPHPGEAQRAVALLRERLRGDRADPGLGPRDGLAHVEPARLHRDTQLAGRRVARDDGVRHDCLLERSSVAAEAVETWCATRGQPGGPRQMGDPPG